MRRYTRGILAIVAFPVIFTGALLIGSILFFAFVGMVEMIPYR